MDGSIHGSSVSARTATPRGGRLDRTLARTSDAPLRKGNHLSLLRNGPNTFDDWLEAISISGDGCGAPAWKFGPSTHRP